MKRGRFHRCCCSITEISRTERHLARLCARCRNIESHSIDPDVLLTSTLATHDRDSGSIAIRMAVDTYINLRADALPENIADDATRWVVLAMLKRAF